MTTVTVVAEQRRTKDVFVCGMSSIHKRKILFHLNFLNELDKVTYTADISVFFKKEKENTTPLCSAMFWGFEAQLRAPGYDRNTFQQSERYGRIMRTYRTMTTPISRQEWR